MEGISSQDEEHLITFVSGHPCLYDSTNTDYENSNARENAWKEIGMQLNKNPEICKSRWKNIKDTYMRQKKKVKRITRSATSKNPRYKFQSYCRLLEFLDIVKEERQEITNIVDNGSSIVKDEYSAQGSEQFLDIGKKERQEITNIVDNGSSIVKDEYSAQGSEQNNVNKTSLSESDRQSVDNKTNVYYDIPQFNEPKNSPQLTSSESPKKMTKQDNIPANLQKREEARHLILVNETLPNNVDERELGLFSNYIKNVLKNLTPFSRIHAKKQVFDVLMKYEMMALELDHL